MANREREGGRTGGFIIIHISLLRRWRSINRNSQSILNPITHLYPVPINPVLKSSQSLTHSCPSPVTLASSIISHTLAHTKSVIHSQRDLLPPPPRCMWSSLSIRSLHFLLVINPRSPMATISCSACIQILVAPHLYEDTNDPSLTSISLFRSTE